MIIGFLLQVAEMLKSHADRGKVDVISLGSSVSRILSELQEAQFLQDDKEKYVNLSTC